MQAANKRKRTAIIVAIAVAAVWCTLLVLVAVQAVNPHLAVAGQQVQTVETGTQQTGAKQMLGWLAMMFGIGEVAGALGMGISSIRRNKRQEREAQKISFTPDNARLLRYEDHLAMLQADVA